MQKNFIPNCSKPTKLTKYSCHYIVYAMQLMIACLLKTLLSYVGKKVGLKNVRILGINYGHFEVKKTKNKDFKLFGAKFLKCKSYASFKLVFEF